MVRRTTNNNMVRWTTNNNMVRRTINNNMVRRTTNNNMVSRTTNTGTKMGLDSIRNKNEGTKGRHKKGKWIARRQPEEKRLIRWTIIDLVGPPFCGDHGRSYHLATYTSGTMSTRTDERTVCTSHIRRKQTLGTSL